MTIGNGEAPDVLVERDDDILRVTLNRPSKHNALSRAVLATLHDIFSGHSSNTGLRAVVLTGAGNRSFAAGGDLRDLDQVRTRPDTVRMAEDAKRALGAVRAFPVPVIAALNGDAMGGGAELAMACDFRIATPTARFGFVQGRLNISTAWGGGIDLMRQMGHTQALGLLCRSEMLSAERAHELGLYDAVAVVGQSLDNLTEKFLEPLRRQAPQVLRAFKTLAHAVRMGWPREHLDQLETRLFTTTWTHEDHWEVAARVLAQREEP